MFKKTAIALTTALVLGGGLFAASGTAEARSRDHGRYERVRICQPVVQWKWRHHHRIRVVVGRDCHWVKVRDHRRRDSHHRRYW